MLAGVFLVAATRGTFWVMTIDVWSRLDEAQHFAYVESLAKGEGVPRVGQDRVSEDVLLIARSSGTSGHRTLPLESDPRDPRWGAFREQYEGIQGPVYYAALVLPYRAFRPLGPLAAVYAVRFASLLLALLTIPLVYLIARLLFPRHEWAWPASAAVLLAVPAFTSAPAAVTMMDW
ncbi:MAG TPA: hypothetical protein VNE62_00950 [Actinomycetota bacterium]|nr:hypothetical protein [Actinomycetota bacterium]